MITKNVIVSITSKINKLLNNLNGEMPRFLKNVSRRLALVSFTKYQTKTVRNNLVITAATIKGLTTANAILTINELIANGL